MSVDLKNLSSNWKKLQTTLATERPECKPHNELKRKRSQPAHPAPRKKTKTMTTPFPQPVKSQTNAGLSEDVEIGRYVSLDCEMVGIGPNGVESALARVSIVNYNGEQIYDSYVKSKEPVTDWRTPISGVAPKHMQHARSFEEVQSTVAAIIKDRVVVGHALRHDWAVLGFGHPERDTKDTARLKEYRKLAGGTPKLSLLASELLGIEIQTGEHSSVEDARAAMLLFRRDKNKFEVVKRKGKRQ
ncbi:3'-5' exonuclease [Neophaeococcomyces mojaviensis]|uniref:3'-5' exonuclease n=1 Tax=Neophaeococcomyces mojaviensis TaxID=3383035 RepID=A0ACC3AAE7_9EURO|nr:3'-5' exonuclease [Knufia sp. JES_112]